MNWNNPVRGLWRRLNRAGEPGGPGRIFYGWWVLAASVVLGFFAFGVAIPGYMAFSVPIRAELGLTSGQSAFVVGAAWGVGDVTSLAAGWLADRYGARRLILAGGLLTGLGFAALGFAESFWAIVVVYPIIASIGRGLGIFPNLMTVVNQWFERRKAFALAVINTGVMGGAAAILPLLSAAAGQFGWRSTAIVAGAFVCVLTIPAVAVLRSRPEDVGLQPYGAGVIEPDPARDGSRLAGAAGFQRLDYSAAQALVTLSFWALTVGAALLAVSSNVLVINQIPILIWKGVDQSRTAVYLPVTYFAIIPACFGMGIAATWASPRWLLGGAMALVALCSVAALLLQGDAVAWFLIVSSATVQGVSALAWITVGEYFGRRSFGTLVGVMTLFYGVSGPIVPAAAGWVFDRPPGSFVPVLVAVGVMQAISAGAFLLAKRPGNPASTAG